MNKKLILIFLTLFTLGAFSESDVSEARVSNCTDLRVRSPHRDVIQSVCQLVNQRRIRAGKKALILDPELSDVAQDHAEDMAKRNFFSHTNPEGLIAGMRLKLAGINWRTWGENIANSYPTPTTVMQGWMNSAGHRANILSPKYGKMGIGYYQNYWVQLFTN